MRNFLLPADYVLRKSYRTNPLYKSTWYILLGLLLVQTVFAGIWYLQKKALEDAEAQYTSVQDEAKALSAQRTKLAQTELQLAAVTRWTLNRRYSATPILSAIESTIPDSIGITSLSIVQSDLDEEKRVVKVNAVARAAERVKNPTKEPAIPAAPTSNKFLVTVKGVTASDKRDQYRQTVEQWLVDLGKVIPGMAEVHPSYGDAAAPAGTDMPKFEVTFTLVTNA